MRHTTEKPQRCSVCDVTFIHKWIYLEHKKSHTGNKLKKTDPVFFYFFSHRHPESQIIDDIFVIYVENWFVVSEKVSFKQCWENALKLFSK